MANSAVHDRVNLLRLVTRLEDDVANRQSWGSSGMSARVKATNASLNLVHARQLLQNIRTYEADSSTPSTSTSTLPDLAHILDGLEPIILEYQKNLVPKRPIRKSLLSDLPRPTPRPTPTLSLSVAPVADEVPSASHQFTAVSEVSDSTNDLFLTPTEQNGTPPRIPSLTPSPIDYPPLPISEMKAPTPTTATDESGSSAARHLTTSLKTQEELSAQLAQMGTQLKMNLIHFNEALARDQAVMSGAEEKLQGNLDRMQTERGRLKVHSAKSGSTTWIVLAAIVTVGVAWVVMFLVIRIT